MARATIGACMLLCIAGCNAAMQGGGSPMDAVTQTMQKLPIVAVTEDSDFFDNATAFFEEMKDKQRPTSPYKHGLEDPLPASGFSSCVRDTTGCPDGFIADGANSQICLPGASYHGPCSGPIELSSMTTSAKARWSDGCLTSWPCYECVRDYSACPKGWTPSEPSAARRCEPPAAYIGACDATSFVTSSASELESWASSCAAEWPCA
eukprot:TRINITY_DN81346_c0_g1_i1.p1 TRINITY_DN81346_c0_g1~~TRINITY_DN81346_c0_g1_i1.p1  ORF type:complete len:229 (-),score=33.52 TRINITY_DN81346_c0_g1_i1:39-659(-)